MYDPFFDYVPKLTDFLGRYESRKVWPPIVYSPSDRNPVLLDDYHSEIEEDDLSASPHGCRSWRNGFWD